MRFLLLLASFFLTSPLLAVGFQVRVSLGPANPGPGFAEADQVDVKVMQIQIDNLAPDDIDLDQLTLQGSGSADDSQVAQVQIFQDFNGDGIFDGADVIIGTGTYPADDGTLVIPLTPTFVGLGGSVTLGVEYNVGTAAGLHAPYVIDAHGISVSLSQTVSAIGVPLQASGLTVSDPRAAIIRGPADPGPQNVGSFAFVPVLQFTLSNTGMESISVQSFDLQASGSVDDSTLYLQLFWDADGDGQFGGPDQFIASTPYLSNDGPATFSFSQRNLAPGAYEHYLVMMNTGTSIGTHETQLVAANVIGQIFANSATLSGLPLSSNTLTIVPPQARIALGPLNPGPQTVGTFSMAPVLQFTVSNSGSEAIRFQGIDVQASGSSDDSLMFAQLVLDVDNNGQLSGPDQFLGGAPFSSDNGVANLNFPFRYLSPGTEETYLVVVNSGTAIGTHTSQLVALNAQGQSSGLAVNVNGSPLNANTLTIVPPQAQVSVGPLNPGPQSVGPFAMTPVLQFTVSNSGSEAIRFQGVDVQASGSSDDSLIFAQLVLDVDNDGQVSGPDQFLGGAPFSGDNGVANLNFPFRYLSPGTEETYLVVVNSGTAIGTHTSQLIALNAQGQSSGLAVNANGLPLSSNTLSIVPPQAQVTLGPLNPGAQTLGTYANGVPLMQFTVSNTGSESIRFQGLDLQASGTADDSQIFLQLVLDVDGDGVYGGPDQWLGQLYYPADNGVANLNFGMRYLPPGTAETYLLVANNNAAVGTHQTQIVSLNAQGQSSGLMVGANGLPLAAGLLTTVPPPLLLQRGASTPLTATVNAGALGVSVLQWSLVNNTGEGVTLSGFKIQGAGTGNEALLAGYLVYADNNDDGVVDGGDTLLGNSNFAIDNGLSTVGISAYGLPNGNQAQFLLAYDVGSAVGTHLPSLGDVIGTGDISGLGVSFSGTAGANTLSVANVTPTMSSTPTTTSTRTLTPSPTSTRTLVSTFSSTATPTRSSTSTATPSSTQTLVSTFSSTATPTQSSTSTVTPSSTQTLVSTFSSTATPTQSSTSTATRSSTQTLVSTFSSTVTLTPTPTRTQTPVSSFSSTGTPTDTSTRTSTAVSTFSYSPTASSTQTPVGSATFTVTMVPTAIPGTPTPTGTISATFTISDTPLPTGTAVIPAVLDRNIFRPGRGNPLQISFRALEDGRVTVRIFNIAGEKVITPFDAEIKAGLWFQAHWDGANDQGEPVGSGVYIISVQGAGIRSLKKVVLLK